MTRAGIAAMWARRRLRIALLAVLIAIPLLGGRWLLLRHSSLSAVEHVQVRGLAGVHGADTAAIETALTGAAHGMSTLAVSPAALRAAVASYPIVRYGQGPSELSARPAHRSDRAAPVAALVVGGSQHRRGGRRDRARPWISVGLAAAPERRQGERSCRRCEGGDDATRGRGSVRGASLLGALAVLGAAPAPLAHAVTRVYSGPEGLTVALRGGLLAYFGDATRPHAKWLSLARVLADPGSAGAAYIDVRLPERPAAGFAPGTVRPDASSTEPESSGAADPSTAAELASGLDAAVGGGSSSSTGTGTTSGSAAGTEPSAGGEATQSGSTPSEVGSTSGEAASASPSSQAGSAETSETPTTSGVPGG